MATLQQINVKPKTPGETGIQKPAVPEANVTEMGVGNDYNHYRYTEHNNSSHRAVLLYTTDKIEQLNAEGWPIKPGDIGENFTIDGISYSDLEVGTKLSVGSIELEVTEICTPCYKLGGLPYVGQEKKSEFLKTMKGRRGWYARVLMEGTVKVGDHVSLM